jgi:DNA-binding XRE family transcriptional regulator
MPACWWLFFEWSLFVTPSLGLDLKRWRQAAELTQRDVAERLGVSRPTITQWEAGAHRPPAERIRELDRLYGAQGELIKIAEGMRPPDHDEPDRYLNVGDIFRNVADALMRTVVVDERGRLEGWSRNLVARSPGTLNTAYVIRTLQLLDDGRVDLDRLTNVLLEARRRDGWGYRIEQQARPEVTAVVLAALARMGRLTDVDNDLDQLNTLVDEFALSRPFVLAVTLEGVLAIRPEAELAHKLTDALLDSRRSYPDGNLWPMSTSAPVERTAASLAHTARSVAILRLARPTPQLKAKVDDAIEAATHWIAASSMDDTGVIEVLEGSETRPSIPIHHFTSAWAIRALAGVKGVPAMRLQAALDVLWASYSPKDSLWTWHDEGTLPSWMTLDAISALRVMAEATTISPFSISTDGDHS